MKDVLMQEMQVVSVPYHFEDDMPVIDIKAGDLIVMMQDCLCVFKYNYSNANKTGFAEPIQHVEFGESDTYDFYTTSFSFSADTLDDFPKADIN